MGVVAIPQVESLSDQIYIPSAGAGAAVSTKMKKTSEMCNLKMFGTGDNPVPYRQLVVDSSTFITFVTDVDTFYDKVGHAEI